MSLFTFSYKLIHFFETKFSKKKEGNKKLSDPRMSMGESLLVNNFYLNVRNPVKEKTYLKIGDACMIDGTFTFETPNGAVTIGDRVFIGKGNVICINKVDIASDVFISWGCYIFDNDSHSLDYRHRLIDMQNHLNDWKNGLQDCNTTKDWGNVNSAAIKICRYVWIGMECKILKGVTIGEGAIVGAGSVVTKDVEPWTIVAGNPAKIVKIIPVELRKSDIQIH